MKKTFLFAALALVVALGAPAARAAEALGWPRIFNTEGAKVVLHQPQADEWEKHAKLTFRSVVVVSPTGEAVERYGVVEIMVKTIPDFEARDVLFYDFAISEIRFPTVPAEESTKLVATVRAALPKEKGATTMALDEVLAYIEKDPAAQKAVEVAVAPPKILYSKTPAVLVAFIGKPRFRPIVDTTLMAAANTNWDVFLDTAQNRYFLLDGETWLTAADPVKGPWTAAERLPADFSKLPAGDSNWESVRKALPLKPATKTLPQVYATVQPAELIVTEGEPTFEAVASTKLMKAANTESVLFLHTEEKNYYFLAAGRWFRAKSLEGPWSAASSNLPADFAAIPDADDAAFVKASVAGTDEAKDAVLLASVPRKTAVKRSEASFSATYDGAPKFVAIEGADNVKFASNSPDYIFQVQGSYYACSQAVWYLARKPEGPWEICTFVPAAIYTIPATHPTHCVTYVYVYDSNPSNPDVVYCGYTSGYSGEYVSTYGVLVFGTGYYDDDWDDDCWHCYPCYYSYGCYAVYGCGYGGYYRAAHYYGPYGGAGRSAYWNPTTGAWSRGAYRYGPTTSAFAASGYNPFTDTYGGRVGASTPYGSSGRFYGERDGDWVRGGHEASARGRMGWAETTDGGKAVAWDTQRGQGAIAKDDDGDLYVGRDGNIYRRDAAGVWRQHGERGWADVPKPDPKAASPARDPSPDTSSWREKPTPPARDTPPPARREPAPPATVDRAAVSRDLERSSAARTRGQQNYQRATAPSGGVRRGGGGGGRRR